MKSLRLFGICLIISLAFFPTVQADDGIGSPTKLRVGYLRQYMEKNRFFDRVNPPDIKYGKSIQELVEAGLEETKRQYEWILREYSWNDSGPYFGAVALLAFITYVSILDELPETVVLGGIIGLAAALVPGVIFIEDIFFTMFPPELPEENLILAYGAKKQLLDERTQSYIEDELFYGFWRSPSSEALYRLQKSLDKALRLPFYSKELDYYEEEIDSVLRNYSPELSKRLKQFAESELIYQQTDADIADSHYPVYFQGPPGTGKTYAAQKLADVMGTNLAVVTLDGANIDDIIGTPFESVEAKAGRILDAIIARTNSSMDINHHNQILFIDEFDRLFLSGNEKTKDVLSFMLKLLDPANRSFYSPYLKTDIRLPDTIILAGNQDIHELSTYDDELQAIASRLDKIVFEGFDRKAKESIAAEIMIPNKEKRFRSAGRRFSNFFLPEKGHEMIYAFIEADEDPGLRSLEKYISKVFEEFANGTEYLTLKPSRKPPARVYPWEVIPE